MLWQDFGRKSFFEPWEDLRGEFQRMQEEMNQLFTWTGRPSAHESPPLSVWVGEDRATIAVEVPGVDPKEIDISVSGEALTIKGNRSEYDLKKNETYHRREREYGSFTRTVSLPFRVESDKVDAKFKNGILTISANRAEADRPKKIAVKSS